MEAHKVELCFYENPKLLVQKSLIGNIWKHDNSVETVKMINQVMNIYCNKSVTYWYYIEMCDMHYLRLKYSQRSIGKGFISMMVI